MFGLVVLDITIWILRIHVWSHFSFSKTALWKVVITLWSMMDSRYYKSYQGCTYMSGFTNFKSMSTGKRSSSLPWIDLIFDEVDSINLFMNQKQVNSNNV